MQILAPNPQFVQETAAYIANLSSPGTVVGLKGSLGAGKSFFASAFINSLLDHRMPVLSPTFNLVYPYQTKAGEVYHFDLYRLKSLEDLDNLGFEEMLSNGISLIEWPEIAKNIITESSLASKYLEITISIINGNQRLFLFDLNSYWQSLFSKCPFFKPYLSAYESPQSN